MSDLADRIRAAYVALGAGDRAPLAALYAPDVVWQGSTSRLPTAGTSRGADEVFRRFDDFAALWRRFGVVAHEVVDGGHTVVVIGHYDVQAHADGAPRLEVPFVQVVRLRDGRIHRVEALTDTAVLAEALAG